MKQDSMQSEFVQFEMIREEYNNGLKKIVAA
ncbi:MAG: hypothetical protein H6Q58_1675 [Firmicutes bacterium]|nr:hypothetical protein [Bacillota bacterium]